MKIFALLRSLRSTGPMMLAVLGFLIIASGGCGNGAAARISDEDARAALEAALKTWRDGGKPGALKGTEPLVQVHDTPWNQGERLGSYEIVGEETGTAEKQFTVRLSLTKPDRVQEVQYYVLGRSPVMVFRDEDYLRNINMVDGPKEKKPGGRRSPRGR